MIALRSDEIVQHRVDQVIVDNRLEQVDREAGGAGAPLARVEAQRLDDVDLPSAVRTARWANWPRDFMAGPPAGRPGRRDQPGKPASN